MKVGKALSHMAHHSFSFKDINDIKQIEGFTKIIIIKVYITTYNESYFDMNEEKTETII